MSRYSEVLTQVEMDRIERAEERIKLELMSWDERSEEIIKYCAEIIELVRLRGE